MKDSYKVKQLQEMLEYEKAQPHTAQNLSPSESLLTLMKVHWNF